MGNLVPSGTTPSENTFPQTWDLSLVNDAIDGISLVFTNNGGTIQKEILIWVPVVVEYGWGHLDSEIMITIKPNPSQNK